MWLADWEREKAEHECGYPLDVCADPSVVWFPQRHVCYPAMEAAAANRRYDALHEAKPYHDGAFGGWSKEATPAAPYHYRDGVTVLVAREDHNPDDDFLSG